MWKNCLDCGRKFKGKKDFCQQCVAGARNDKRFGVPVDSLRVMEMNLKLGLGTGDPRSGYDMVDTLAGEETYDGETS